MYTENFGSRLVVPKSLRTLLYTPSLCDEGFLFFRAILGCMLRVTTQQSRRLG